MLYKIEVTKVGFTFLFELFMVYTVARFVAGLLFIIIKHL